jgi:hypothetical protein
VDDSSIEIDVYAVLEAFQVTCPARAHAIKKLLCTGTRGKGDAIADLTGAAAAVDRAISIERQRQRTAMKPVANLPQPALVPKYSVPQRGCC